MEDGISMNGQASKLVGVAAVLLLTVACFTCGAADKGDKAKVKDEAKAVELLTPSKEYQEKQAAVRDYSKEIDAELAARAVPVPPEMDLDLEWYSPHLDVAKFGRMIKGWATDDIVLLETDKHNLLCVRRTDGVQQWTCELTGPVRYSPSVSRNNVLVNINNVLVAIHREAGYVRWRLQPNFVMSCSPLLVDPPSYPKDYTKDWKNLETIFAGGWDGRFYCMFVRGRMTLFVKNLIATDNFSAPEFELFNAWHKTPKDRGIITSNVILKDNILYYTADDHNVYAVSREGMEREPYYLLGAPCTGVTVTASAAANVTNSVLSSLYIGARDDYVYCLDRLTLKKKWQYAPGYHVVNTIMADEAATPYVYVATSEGALHALKVQPARSSKGQPETPESFAPAWEAKGADGVVTSGPDIVYAGSGHFADANGYKGIMAIDKDTGKVLWKNEGGFFTQFIEFHNSWMNPKLAARVYALTTDNRLVSFKEKVRDTGMKAIKAPAPEPEQPKMPGKKGAKAAPAEGGADAAKPAAEAKKEEPKKEEPKKE